MTDETNQFQNPQQPPITPPPLSEPIPPIPPDKDAKMWAMFCHLGGLAGIVFPFVGNIVLPLIFWQIKKDQYPFVDEHGKEAVNFQITMTIAALISVVLFVICIGPFVLSAVGIVDIIFLIIAAIKANDGKSYRYPLTIRFIK